MIPKAVLFDCDGVLVDSEPTTLDLIGEELSAHGLPLTHDEMDALFIGGTITKVFEKSRALGARLPDGWIDYFYETLYARLAKGTDLMPGTQEMLDALDSAGIKYAVGSNGTQRKMNSTLSQHPSVWLRLESHLFSGQELGCPKPDPKLYLTAAKSLGVAPEHCVVVDDSATGCLGGLNAKMRTIGFASGKRDGLDALGIEVAADMRELAELLGL